MYLAQWDKLIEQILRLDKNLRYENLSKALETIGYRSYRPGGSHVTFRKDGKMPVTIPKGNPVNRAYIELVREAVILFKSEV